MFVIYESYKQNENTIKSIPTCVYSYIVYSHVCCASYTETLSAQYYNIVQEFYVIIVYCMCIILATLLRDTRSYLQSFNKNFSHCCI